MNKIYRVIWSKTKNCYIVVSEIAKRNGKCSSSLNKKIIAAFLAAGTVLSVTGSAWAGSPYLAPDQSEVSNGSGLEVYTVPGTTHQYTGTNAGIDVQLTQNAANGANVVVAGVSNMGNYTQGGKILLYQVESGSTGLGQVYYGEIQTIEGVYKYTAVEKNGILYTNLAKARAAGVDVDSLTAKGYKVGVVKPTGGTINTAIQSAAKPTAVTFGVRTEKRNDGYFQTQTITKKVSGTMNATAEKDVVSEATVKTGDVVTAFIDEDDNTLTIGVNGEEITYNGVHYYSVNDGGTQTGNYNNTGATGLDAIAAGPNASATGASSIAIGNGAQATGDGAIAIGEGSTGQLIASGEHSYVHGFTARALGPDATAWGILTQAGQNKADREATWQMLSEMDHAGEPGEKAEYGIGATAWGQYNKAYGTDSTAFGEGNTAYGIHSTVFGTSNVAYGRGATAWGEFNEASGYNSTVFGQSNVASGYQATAFGNFTEASGDSAATAFGISTTASGFMAATAFGYGTTASGSASTAFGSNTTASGYNATSFGMYTAAEGDYSTAFGYGSKATNNYATAFGASNTASGQAATAFGNATTASGNMATAFGSGTTASAGRATAFGVSTTASNQAATAFGNLTTASGLMSTAFGQYTEASGKGATAFGIGTANEKVTASGEGATAFGSKTTAAGKYSTAFGVESKAYGDNSLAALGGTTGEISVSTDQETGASVSEITENAKGAVAIGEGAIAKKSYTYAIGQGAQATMDDSIAFGNSAQVTVADGIALGRGSVASTPAGVVGANPLNVEIDVSNPAWTSTASALSIGNVKITRDGDGNITSITGTTRQITGVAAGTNPTDAVNVAQLQGTATHYYSVDERKVEDVDTSDSNYDNSGAKGAGSLAAGYFANATGDESTAFGYGSQSKEESSSSLGSLSKASAKFATAVGHSAQAIGENSTATGTESVAAGLNSTAVGLKSEAFGRGTIAIGHESTAGALVKVNSEGEGVDVYYTTEVIRGGDNDEFIFRTLNEASTNTNSEENTSGENTESTENTSSVTPGRKLMAVSPLKAGLLRDAVVPLEDTNDTTNEESGTDSETTGTVVAFNVLTQKYHKATPDGKGGYTIGEEIQIDETSLNMGGIAMGSYAHAEGYRSMSIGRASGSYGEDSTAMGIYANAMGTGDMAIGHGASTGVKAEINEAGADDFWTTTLKTDKDTGNPVANGNSGGIAIGSYSHTEGTRALAVGRVASAYGTNSTAIGLRSSAYGEGSMAFGHGVVAGDVNHPDAAQVKELHDDPTIPYDLDGSDGIVDPNNVIGAIAMGSYAEATARGSLSVGRYSKAQSAYSTAMGIRATVGAGSNNGMAIGRETTVGENSLDAIAVGDQAKSYGAGSITFGHGSSAGLKATVNAGETTDDNWTTTIDTDNTDKDGNLIVTGTGGIAIGSYSHTEGTRALAVGRAASAYGTNSTALGLRSSAYGEGSMAFGHGVVAGDVNHPYAVQVKELHDDPTIPYDLDGSDGIVDPTNVIGAVAMGSYAEATGRGSLSVGRYSKAQSAYSTAMGIRATVGEDANNAIAIGRETTIAKGSENSIAIGKQSTVTGTDSIAIGTGHIVKGNNSGAIGDPNKINGSSSYILGNNSAIGTINSDENPEETEITVNDSFIIGNNSSITAANGFVLGNNASVTEEGGVALGTGSVADTKAGVSGYDPATGTASTATDAAWKSTAAALSVGGTVDGKTVTRQITGVAAGTNDTDAVNVAQLKSFRPDVQEGNNITVTSKEDEEGHTVFKIDGFKTLITSKDESVTVTGGEADEDGVITYDLSVEKTLDTDTKYELSSEKTDNDNGATYKISLKDLDGNEAGVAEVTDTRNTIKAGDDSVNIESETNEDGSLTYTITAKAKGSSNVKVIDGKNTTVTEGKDGDFTTYAVDVKTDGKVASGDTGIVTGDTVYNETRVQNDGNYIKKDNTAAENITALDNQVNNNAQNIENLGSQINNTYNQINRLDSRMKKGLAGAAALAALHPMDFNPDDKLQFSAGVGNYRGETAAAVGAFYRPDESVMFSIGGTFGNGDNMVNAGITFGLDGTRNRITRSRTAMAREIQDLRSLVTQMAARMDRMEAANGIETAMFPDVPENHWAYEYVEDLQKRGALKGYPDGLFKGDRAMTRYEFAAMLDRIVRSGVTLDSQIAKEFEPELGRIYVERISGQDNDRKKVERVRVNNSDSKYPEGKTRDVYGSKLPVAEAAQ